MIIFTVYALYFWLPA